MKTLLQLTPLIALAILPLQSSDNHGHDQADHRQAYQKIIGPNEGRVLTELEPHIELFVTKDRKVRLTPVTDERKVLESGELSATLVGGSRANPTRLSFEKDGNSLLSEAPLPDAKIIPVILFVKTSLDAKKQIARINVNLNLCPDCKDLEYACKCEH